MKRPDPGPAWQPLPARRRLLIALLAVAMAVAVVLVLTGRPGGADLGEAARAAQQAECRASQQAGCVGGKAEAYAVPAPTQR